MQTNAPYLLFCSREPHNELIAAEVQQLTGGEVDEFGVAFCAEIARTPHAAYIQAVVKILAMAPDFEHLVRKIAAQQIVARNFRIQFMSRASHHLMPTRQAVIQVANVWEVIQI